MNVKRHARDEIRRQHQIKLSLRRWLGVHKGLYTLEEYHAGRRVLRPHLLDIAFSQVEYVRCSTQAKWLWLYLNQPLGWHFTKHFQQGWLWLDKPMLSQMERSRTRQVTRALLYCEDLEGWDGFYQLPRKLKF